MDEVSSLANALKGYGGYFNSVTTILIALLAYWKGLPALIEAGGKLLEIWSNRAASIEERLNNSVKQRFDQFEHDIAAMRQQHTECQEENEALRKRVKFLEDKDFLREQEITGMKRQLAHYEAHGGAPTPVVGALFLPPDAKGN